MVQPCSSEVVHSRRSCVRSRGRCSFATKNTIDCLSEAAYVWTEGSVRAQPVGSLMAGHRVLCYDRLADNVCHDEVVMVHSETSHGEMYETTVGTAEEITDLAGLDLPRWVSILLEDGSCHEMTSCHPVRPRIFRKERNQWIDNSEPIAASSLRPGCHCLMVTKLAPMPVLRVTHVDKTERAIVTVRLWEHSRYQILATERHAASTLVAVGGRYRYGRDGSTPYSGYIRDMVSEESSDPGDDLPAGMFVWTEGSISAQPLGSVRVGQRLLCYDRVAVTMAYAAVTELVFAATEGATAWVSLTLEDGTQQNLLASCALTPLHPPSQSDGMDQTFEELSCPIAASSLSLGVHSIMVVKSKPVAVARVSTSEGAGRQVAVTLKHPDRCDLLVCPSGGSCVMMAVGSVLRGSGSRSSGSDPSSSTRSSLDKSSNSSSSVASTDIELILGGVTTRDSTSAWKKNTVWSDYMSLRNFGTVKADFGSLGTMAHEMGICTVCMFHERYASGRFTFPCKVGALCDRCHARHPRSGFHVVRGMPSEH